MSWDRPQRAAGIEIAELGRGLLVRQAEPPRVHQLNNTASIVLELCDGHHTVAEIAGALAGAFTLDAPPLDEAAACVAGLRRAGVLAGRAVGNPDALGLDAASPMVLLALVLPALREPAARWAALAGAVIALTATPFLPGGLPVLLALAGLAAVAFPGARGRSRPGAEGRA